MAVPVSPPRCGIIIPARYASHRFPGKPLALLEGSTGESKSLVQRSWECAQKVDKLIGVWVATDDERIADEVRNFGGEVIMTSPSCRNGTERCADALAKLGNVADIIVNLQGDAPLTPGVALREIIDALSIDPVASVATPAIRCSPTLYRHLVKDQAEGRVGGTTVVFNQASHALYFSKRVIPHVPFDTDEAASHVHLHIGAYAYRPKALKSYAALAPSPLESLEGLEQLRFLEMGLPIKVVPLDPIPWDCIELNNPEDKPAIEAVLKSLGIA